MLEEQGDGWVSRRLKLSPRGYLTCKIRFEDADTPTAPPPVPDSDFSPTGAPLTAFERHVRDHSPATRGQVDEVRFAKRPAHGGPR